jgi:hypothetical protein|tara:strand:- start:205 stop:432 length:228 start_codon:yes stop_codon:yes gene_type:complete
MNEEHISDIWTMFKEYVDKKQMDLIAEKFVDLLADYGVSDETFKEVIGTDSNLDEAISYYLDLDNIDDDEEEWDE